MYKFCFLENSFQNIDKSVFTKYFSQLVTGREAFKRAHVVSGFESTGIFPLDRTRIPEEKLSINRTFQHVVSARNTQDPDEGDVEIDSGDDDDGSDDTEDSSEDDSDDSNDSDDSEGGRGGEHVMHFGRGDDDDDEQSQVVLSIPRLQSERNEQLLSTFLTNQLSKPTKSSITISKKRAKVVGPSGACITSQDSQRIMQSDENDRVQKRIDNERVKKERESKKRKLDEEAARKKELAQIKRNIKQGRTAMNALRRGKLTKS